MSAVRYSAKATAVQRLHGVGVAAVDAAQTTSAHQSCRCRTSCRRTTRAPGRSLVN